MEDRHSRLSNSVTISQLFQSFVLIAGFIPVVEPWVLCAWSLSSPACSELWLAPCWFRPLSSAQLGPTSSFSWHSPNNTSPPLHPAPQILYTLRHQSLVKHEVFRPVWVIGRASTHILVAALSFSSTMHYWVTHFTIMSFQTVKLTRQMQHALFGKPKWNIT